ncbi:MAG: FAD-binding protein [Sporomusaceae bacterium]|nr:FAD-binding protein [Sporomusaceae bacterium]
MEFVQFHPTATLLSDRVFLLTEALRGEGAVLCNAAGERFMFDYHPAGELAPRDEVARAILRESERQGNQPVYLDARQLGKSCLADRFRQVYTKLAQAGCAMERELIPVFPAAHYSIGGIKTDLSGETTIPALFACGEAAATGVHGANRLASNSLLEGVVFGRRVAAAIEGKRQTRRKTSPRLDSDPASGDYSIPVEVLRSRLDCVVGVRRRGDELEAMLNWLNKPVTGSRPLPPGRVLWQERNARQLAELLLEAALLRQESRGAHFRSDYPGQEANCSGRHSVQQWGRKAVME